MRFINVDDLWFNFMWEGKKTVEGRLLKGKIVELKIGDRIMFLSKSGSALTKRIIGLITYDSFEKMLLGEGLENVLPNVPDVASGVTIYRKYYSVEDEQKYGVLAIKIDDI